MCFGNEVIRCLGVGLGSLVVPRFFLQLELLLRLGFVGWLVVGESLLSLSFARWYLWMWSCWVVRLMRLGGA